MSTLPPADSQARWRFSLGSILLLLTAFSIPLAVFRAVPLSPEMRQALLLLTVIWLIGGTLLVAPAWFRFRRLRAQANTREAEMQAFLEAAKRRQASGEPEQGT